MNMCSYRDDLFKYVKQKFDRSPEYPWTRYPDYAVFRHSDNQKWFALVMAISKIKLGLSGQGHVDILNVKLDDPLLVDLLVQQTGYFRGYHINRGNWISILLDGAVPFEDICDMLDKSYLVTASKQEKQRIRPPKEWLIPANPKYFDIVHAFNNASEINWKQGTGIKKGDTVFMYVAAPVSAILYQCEVIETNIPYRGNQKNIQIRFLMRIRLKKRYQPERFTFDILNVEYGIFAVRGPRGIPESLSRALNE